MSSCCLNGIRFELRNPVLATLSQIRLYLHNFGFDNIILAVNIPCAKRIIAALSLVTRSYCSHNGSNGIILSHCTLALFLFNTSYGKSHITQSTIPSGIRFIPSRQSSLYILFSSIILYKFNLLFHSVSCISPTISKHSSFCCVIS